MRLRVLLAILLLASLCSPSAAVDLIVTGVGGSQLPADPAPCPADKFVTDQTQSGVLTCTQPSSSNLSDAASLLKTTGTQKVTGLQVVPRECTPTVTANAITPDMDLCDDLILNALAAGLTINAPTGTGGNPACNQQFSLRIKSTTLRPLTHHAIFSASGRISLPTATTGDGTGYDYWLYRYNCDEAKWNIIANNQLLPAEITVGEVDGTPSGPVNSIKFPSNALSITGKEATITFPAGGTGGTGTVQLPITGPALTGLGGFSPAVIDSSLNNRALVFESTFDQCVIWDFVVPADFTSGPIWKWWYVKSGGTPTAGQTVRFDVSIMKLLTSAPNIETDGYDTLNNCTDSTTQTAVNVLDTELGNSCNLTNFDTAVAGNAIKLKACHNSSDSVDGQIRLVRSALYYTR